MYVTERHTVFSIKQGLQKCITHEVSMIIQRCTQTNPPKKTESKENFYLEIKLVKIKAVKSINNSYKIKSVPYSCTLGLLCK